MEVLYHQSQKLLLEIQNYLPHLERNIGKEAVALEQTILGKLEELTRFDTTMKVVFQFTVFNLWSDFFTATFSDWISLLTKSFQCDAGRQDSRLIS